MLQSRIGPSRTSLCIWRGADARSLLSPSCSLPCIPPLNMQAEALPERRLHACSREDGREEWHLPASPTQRLACTHTHSQWFARNSCSHWAPPESCRLLHWYRVQVHGGSQRRAGNQQGILTYCNKSSWVTEVKHWSLRKASISAKKGRVPGTMQSYLARLSVVPPNNMHAETSWESAPILYNSIREEKKANYSTAQQMILFPRESKSLIHSQQDHLSLLASEMCIFTWVHGMPRIYKAMEQNGVN